MPQLTQASAIPRYYASLLQRYGPQNWWPAQSRFEVIVGAYLTQNTNWSNVEKAVANLRRARALNMKALRALPLAKLEELVRPSGYFRQKAARLKGFIAFLDEKYSGSLDRMFAQPSESLRAELLALNGVGPETADSILLYAGNHPVFVVDAYTRRILDRHKLLTGNSDYEEIRALFEGALSPIAKETVEGLKVGIGAVHLPSPMSTARRSAFAQAYNEMHGLIVGVGKNYCRKAKGKC